MVRTDQTKPLQREQSAGRRRPKQEHDQSTGVVYHSYLSIYLRQAVVQNLAAATETPCAIVHRLTTDRW